MTDDKDADENNAGAPAEGSEAPTQEPKVDETVEDRKAAKALRTDAAKMKAHLDKQKKVSMMIPFEAGENPEQAKNIPFHVNLNGYVLNIPRGVYTDVPEQVADVIRERLESEGKIGQEWRIDKNPNKQAALGA